MNTTYYYEYSHGQYYLWIEGQIEHFFTRGEMVAFIDEKNVNFVQVTPDNWEKLEKAGVFE